MTKLRTRTKHDENRPSRSGSRVLNDRRTFQVIQNKYIDEKQHR